MVEVSVELKTVVLVHHDTVLVELSLALTQERLVWVMNVAFLLFVATPVWNCGLQVVDLRGRDANGVLVDGAHRELLEDLGFELAANLSDRALLAHISEEPVLLKQLTRRHPAVRVHIEHLLHHVEAVIGQVATNHLEGAPVDLAIQLCVRLAFEREEAVEQTEQEHA